MNERDIQNPDRNTGPNPILLASREKQAALANILNAPNWEKAPKETLEAQALLASTMSADISRELDPTVQAAYGAPSPEELSELQRLLTWAQETQAKLAEAANKRDLKF